MPIKQALTLKWVWQLFFKSNPNVWMILGGLFYSSWVLGFWLNPFVAHRLASDL
jgi:hypothetical protein